jgi:hypothetical protein
VCRGLFEDGTVVEVVLILWCNFGFADGVGSWHSLSDTAKKLFRPEVISSSQKSIFDLISLR